tara:strand:- start:24511 stop:24711 length:201 start_codon:yes stop_codon:yes gene_type:complete
LRSHNEEVAQRFISSELQNNDWREDAHFEVDLAKSDHSISEFKLFAIKLIGKYGGKFCTDISPPGQ